MSLHPQPHSVLRVVHVNHQLKEEQKAHVTSNHNNKSDTVDGHRAIQIVFLASRCTTGIYNDNSNDNGRKTNSTVGQIGEQQQRQ